MFLVIQFNPQTGRLINKALFTLPQDNIIATGHAENVRFSGINSDVSSDFISF